jgi:CxxC-x17-CxxC domain-containing protein
MGNFNRDDKGGFRSSGRDDRNGGRQGGFQKKEWGGRDSGNKEPMKHQATCSECGKRCEVPFRPVNGKPVYCNDCFSAKRGQDTRDTRVPAKVHYENRGGGDEGVKRQLSEMSMKIDRLIKTMEAFTGTGTKLVPVEAPKKEEKKSVNVLELKKVLDKATEKELVKKAIVKEVKAPPKKTVKKPTVAKKKK